MHAPDTYPYTLAAVGLYVFDHLSRLARTRYTTAWLTAEHALNGGTTLVHVPSLGAGWRAGQHVRLRVVTNGWFDWWATWLGRARPFTVATGPDSRGMVIPIKANGSWTRNLLRMASEAADARPGKSSMDTERGGGPAREVRVIVEGPYSKHWVFLFCGNADMCSRWSWVHTLHCLFRSRPRRWGQWHFIRDERTG